jgi:transcriptional regulator with XRE-family HTH domain
MTQVRDAIGAVIGRNIAFRRAELGFSLEQLSDGLAIEPSLMADYESGAQRIDAKDLLALGRILDVPPQYFFAETGMGRSGMGSGREDTGAARMSDFENSRRQFIKDGIRLNQAFAGIRNSQNRQILIDIARALANIDSEGSL